MILYHFTTKAGYDGIIQDGFEPTYFSEALDASYGEGWYFTTLGEHTDKEELERYLWATDGENQDKCHSYLKFQIADKLLKDGRQYVHLLPIEKLEESVISIRSCPYKFKDGSIAIKYLGGGKCPN